MLSRTLRSAAWFPTALALAAPLALKDAVAAAQRLSFGARQLVAAGVWSEARYNYAYWDAVRADWDSAFAAVVTDAAGRGSLSDVQFFRRLRRFVALLGDGQAEGL